MRSKHKPILIAVCLIALGTAWLLNNIGVMPGVNWIWTLSLAAVALVILAAAGLDKLTAVVVPLLILASIASVLRQTGKLDAVTLEPHLGYLKITREVACLKVAVRYVGVGGMGRHPRWTYSTWRSGSEDEMFGRVCDPSHKLKIGMGFPE